MTKNAPESPIELIAARAELTVAEVDPADTLEDVGLDSLSLMELAVSMQSLYGIDVPEGALTASQTVDSAARYLTARIEGVPASREVERR